LERLLMVPTPEHLLQTVFHVQKERTIPSLVVCARLALPVRLVLLVALALVLRVLRVPRIPMSDNVGVETVARYLSPSDP
jgi:hypothetical protein